MTENLEITSLAESAGVWIGETAGSGVRKMPMPGILAAKQMKKIPFSILAGHQISLTEQVERGFRMAIRSGYYAKGERLPSLADAAGGLGVSSSVVRNAIRRLCDEGLVVSRPRTGIEVRGDDARVWHAHVLYCHWGGPDSWYFNVRDEHFLTELHKHNVMTSRVRLIGPEIEENFRVTRTLLDSQAITMAVLETGTAQQVDDLLARRQIPFVQVFPNQVSAFSTQALLLDWTPALRDVRDHCLRCGFRSAMLVLGRQDKGALGEMLEDAGIAVSVLTAPYRRELGTPEGVERSTLDTMLGYLRKGEKLPDFVYFEDDFAARAGLLALTTAGIQIPRDVQVIGMANLGHGPIFVRPLTRVEFDPVAHGRAMADFVLKALKKPWKKRPPVVISPRFIPGETTVPRDVMPRPEAGAASDAGSAEPA